jgi:protein phosphatase PTC7
MSEVTGPWLWSGAHQIPKVGGRCEDAYFVGNLGLGVADGVGSLAKLSKHGVDPAAYARELMHLAEEFMHQRMRSRGSSASLAEDAAADELAAAAMASAEREATTYGAATATVLQLKGSVMGVANLGDSGFMVLRRGGKEFQIVARSKEQQHGWNYPYQLSRLPRSLLQRLPPGSVPDTAGDCDRYQVACQPGDLVLLFTDGIIDNLHNFEILEIVERSTACCDGPEAHDKASRAGLPNPYALSCDLARAAFEKSLDQGADTPFAVASRTQSMPHVGGKCDDITIAAAWVMPPSANGRQFS